MSKRSIPTTLAALAVVALAAVALAAGASRAEAQDITSPYDFVESSQQLWFFGSAVLTDRGAIDVGPGSGYGGGMGYSVRISGPFNIDARAAYLPTTRRVYDIDPDADPEAVNEDPMVGLTQVGTADLSILIVDASLRFDVTGPRTWYRLQPYALVGLGGVLRLSSDNAAESELADDSQRFVRFENGFTGHVGGGIEWYVTDRFTVRADARDVLWQVDVPEGFFVQSRVIDESEWVQTAHFSLGLSVRF